MTRNDETWLERWLPLIRERARDRPVLELGCGSGRDTALLAVAGCKVIALDLSLGALATARARVPVAEFHCQDIRAPFPSGARNLGVVLASLSMHYFEWNETQRLVRRIAETLDPGGILVCRVNAVDDHSYGASGHPEIEPNYFSVDGQAKRFFDEAALDQLFADWTILSREHHMIDRYAAMKAVWETIVERR
jgi:SAM-dependent methyltransferase